MKKVELSENFTYGKLIVYALPSILNMLVSISFQMVDGYFVSNLLGVSAFAAVNLVMPLCVVMFALGLMFGTGSSAVAARYLGSGEEQKAREIFSCAVVVMIAVGLILGGILVLLMPTIGRMVGASVHSLDDCVIYGRWVAAFLFAFIITYGFQSLWVTAGKAWLGTVIAVINGAMNAVLDWVFMVPLKMGVTGAALATSLAALTGMIITLVYFARPNSSSLRLAIPKLRSFREMGAVCFNGASEMVDSVSGNLTQMVVNGQLMRFYGETGVAAMSVFGYIASVFLSISYGFSNAIITIAGYKVGEKKKQEIHELLRRSTVLQILTGAVMGVLCWLLAKPIATLYVGYDEATLGLAVKVLKISSVACLLYGFDTFCGAFFTGLGDGLGSIIISFTLSLAAPVVSVLLLPEVWGAEAIWYLYPVFTLATAILCAGMLKWRYPAWMRQLEKNGWNVDTKD